MDMEITTIMKHTIILFQSQELFADDKSYHHKG